MIDQTEKEKRQPSAGSFWLGLLAASMILCAVPPSSVGAVDRFCAPGPAVDYLRPFAGLPALNPLPEELPFGPRGSSLYRSNVEGSVISRDRSVDYSLGLGWLKRKRRIDWTLVVRVRRINSDGDQIGRTVMRSVRAPTPNSTRRVSVPLPLPASYAALFESEIIIENRGGKKLGVYGEYFRTLPARFRAELRTDAHEYVPGQVIRTRLLNLGTTQITFGEAVEVDAFNGTSWVSSPTFPAEKIRKVLRGLEPGGASGCFEVPVDLSVPTGLYRIVKSVTQPFALKDRERYLVATFEVR